MLRIYKILPFIILLLLGFATPANPPTGNWYQQFMPNLSGRQITDITFIDSLTGFAATNSNGQYDTAFIFKTTNSGDNWYKSYYRTAWFTGFNRIVFIDQNTGFVCGVSVSGGPKGLTKTTDGGISWTDLNIPDPYLNYLDMSISNVDTIWLVSSESLTGGVYLTTNSGVSWTRQLNLSNENPRKIYMYNRNFGFVSSYVGDQLYRTTNGGNNWTQITGENGFRDMSFVDTLTGWKAYGPVKKTTNGGLNWIQQTMPYGGYFSFTGAGKLSVLNRDTIWAVGGNVQYPNLQDRGVIYRTTNGGNNWLFQIPDTTIQLSIYYFVQFINRNTGWAYTNYNGGIHTTAGGDPGWLADVKQISKQVPKEFKLYQNYPNPFNPSTIIRFQISRLADIRLVVYDITGKEIKVLVNQEQNVGTYQVDFSGIGISSGVYFYSLIVDGKLIDTKKFILIK